MIYKEDFDKMDRMICRINSHSNYLWYWHYVSRRGRYELYCRHYQDVIVHSCASFSELYDVVLGICYFLDWEENVMPVLPSDIENIAGQIKKAQKARDNVIGLAKSCDYHNQYSDDIRMVCEMTNYFIDKRRTELNTKELVLKRQISIIKSE